MEHVTVGDVRVPAIGLGTYRLRGKECERVVRDALACGYRHVDTAEFYDDQAAIGNAISASPVDRDELFLTTKVWKTNLQHEQVLRSATDSLEELGVEYVDLLLIHWPNESVPVEETLGAMNQLQREGRVRHIGVSNFSVAQLREAMEASATPVLTDQVKYNPYTEHDDLLSFCLDEDVLLTAYSPLAKGRVADDGALADIGGRYGKSAAQVALRWLVQQDVVAAIPKAASREHLRANVDVFDFELTTDEMNRIFDLTGGVVQQLRNKLGI